MPLASIRRAFGALLTGVMATVLVLPAWGQTADTSADAVKWHPGHYVTLVGRAGDDAAYMREVLDELDRHPALRGVQIRYTWAQLEPEPGVFKFDAIERDLAALAERGKRLFILLQTKSFDARRPLVPNWLLSTPYEGGVFALRIMGTRSVASAGENIRLWNPQVSSRLSGLVQALGAKFDRHPFLEGIAMTETAMGQPVDGPIDAVREQRYFENLLSVLTDMRRAFPHTVTFQFVNFPRRILPFLVSGMRDIGVGLGGPDVFLDDPSLHEGVYPYYGRLAGIVPLAPSVQHENYVAKRARGPADPPDIAELYDFARARLKANYLFWTRRVYGDDKPYLKVLAYIEKPGFPRDPAGGLATACPSAYKACAP